MSLFIRAQYLEVIDPDGIDPEDIHRQRTHASDGTDSFVIWIMDIPRLRIFTRAACVPPQDSSRNKLSIGNYFTILIGSPMYALVGLALHQSLLRVRGPCRTNSLRSIG